MYGICLVQDDPGSEKMVSEVRKERHFLQKEHHINERRGVQMSIMKYRLAQIILIIIIS